MPIDHRISASLLWCRCHMWRHLSPSVIKEKERESSGGKERGTNGGRTTARRLPLFDEFGSISFDFLRSRFFYGQVYGNVTSYQRTSYSEIIASLWLSLRLQHVTLGYSPSLPAALKDVSFIIAGGMQARIVGRTGARKSSILNTIFHLNPICQGHILVDGINIADASIRDLRSHFSVVPQSPFLFEGSLRDNLDPFRVSDDLQIWKTLEKCHVKEEVEAAGGLDARIKQSGTSFSVGQ